ncbi:MAG TPA: type II restriction endonuclease [Methylococcus sp.]|nr:type II restriction endonuclease [Methylococcus sp.]
MIGRHGRDLAEWLDEISGDEWTWFAKRLSANDTGLTRSHQVGIYLPKEVAFPLLHIPIPLPAGFRRANPDRRWDYHLVSHGQQGELRLIYYNQGTRNECRMTGFGGRSSPLQDPENTSALAVFAFRDDGRLEAWLARDPDEADLIENLVGPVVPGIPVHRHLVDGALRLDELLPRDWCEVSITDLPAAWGIEFPPPAAITDEVVRRIPHTGIDPDSRLMRRYECEFRIFRVVEEAHVLPTIRAGFTEVEPFLSFASGVMNRRKSRAGRSLELHIQAILDEEGIAYSAQVLTEPGSKVDFLFPSLTEYHQADPEDPALRMLAVKTTLKDRWRQVLEEASKIRLKHLLTLDEGVSLSQYQAMKASGIELVVPQRNVAKFPEAVRLDLRTLSGFLDLVRRPSVQAAGRHEK